MLRNPDRRPHSKFRLGGHNVEAGPDANRGTSHGDRVRVATIQRKNAAERRELRVLRSPVLNFTASITEVVGLSQGFALRLTYS